MASSNGSSEGRPILHFSAKNVDPAKCPFTNSTVSFTLRRSGCLHLAGPSGAGKTTLSNYIAGILPPKKGRKMLRNTLGIEIEQCTWDESIPEGERAGMLFQQTTLIDSLTVAGNVCVALEHCPSAKNGKEAMTEQQKPSTIKRLLETVGLDYLRDGPKRPSELSGGMARRASLALQLAQDKHVIVLDEPFAGLDYVTGVGVARELDKLRREKGTALLLISHEPDIVDIVMGKAKTISRVSSSSSQNEDKTTLNASGTTVTLARRDSVDDKAKGGSKLQHPSVFGNTPALRSESARLLSLLPATHPSDLPGSGAGHLNAFVGHIASRGCYGYGLIGGATGGEANHTNVYWRRGR